MSLVILPAVHSLHESCLGESWYLPNSQRVHVERPARGEYLPARQSSQDSDRALAAKVPGEQSVHTLEPSGANFPATQLMHVSLPADELLPRTQVKHELDPATEYRPAAHVAQLNAAFSGEILPDRQFSQTARPSLEAYVPAIQSSHSFMPTAPANLPTLHMAQVEEAPGAYFPEAQASQLVDKVSEMANPGAQSVHKLSPAASVYFPEGHSLQSDWAGLSWYFPGSHCEHDDAPKVLNEPGAQASQSFCRASLWKYPGRH